MKCTYCVDGWNGMLVCFKCCGSGSVVENLTLSLRNTWIDLVLRKKMWRENRQGYRLTASGGFMPVRRKAA